MKKFVISFFLLISISFSLMATPKVALVLSGGAALGLAEIPLIEAMEDEGIPIDMVLGTSFGAILGALYTAGHTPKEIRELMLNLNFMEILNEKAVSLEKLPQTPFEPNMDSYLSFSFAKDGIGSAPGLMGDQNIVIMLSDLLSRVMTTTNFDDFPVPFRAIATDGANGNLMVLDSGSIVSAVRASMSLPAVWTPAPINGETYAFDGGLKNNLPIKVAKEMGADVIIAMDVMNNVNIDPKTLADLSTVSMQTINMVISNSAKEQYELADLTLKPNLSKYSMLDFLKVKELIEIGQDCVEENREAIHQIALKLKEQGVEITPKIYNRKSLYSKLPDPIIESVVVRDVSLMDPCPLPLPEEFKSIIGKPLDDKTKKQLSDRLYSYTRIYHLTSLTYFAKPGSEENTCVLEIQANHYKQKMSKLFFGGNNYVDIGKPEIYNRTRIIVAPDYFAGIYLIAPIETLLIMNITSTSEMGISIFPVFKVFDNGAKLGLQARVGFEFLSEEPKTNILYKERYIAEDNGFLADVAFQFRYIDMVNTRLGLKFDSEFVNFNKKVFNIAELYFDGIANTLGEPLTNFRGVKVQVLAKYGINFNDFFDEVPDITPHFNFRLSVNQRFELIKDWTALGYDINAGMNRFPCQLNSGYNEYGGIEGMCGFADGTLKRDFAVAGLSFQQKISAVAGMPIITTLYGRIGISDDYSPFIAEEPPANAFFNGLSQLDYGMGLYASFKTLFGTFLFGYSLNSRGLWYITIGLK